MNYNKIEFQLLSHTATLHICLSATYGYHIRQHRYGTSTSSEKILFISFRELVLFDFKRTQGLYNLPRCTLWITTRVSTTLPHKGELRDLWSFLVSLLPAARMRIVKALGKGKGSKGVEKRKQGKAKPGRLAKKLELAFRSLGSMPWALVFSLTAQIQRKWLFKLPCSCVWTHTRKRGE